MRVFKKDGKLNIIDENNVLVGFDYNKNCCEIFGYFFSPEKPNDIPDYAECIEEGEEEKDFKFNHSEYVFDTSFFEKIDVDEDGYKNMAIFRLINKKNNEVFLCLYNCNNVVYHHGFEMICNGLEKYSGEL